MPRLMSVAYTEQQVRDRTKRVTRRLGWRFAKPGDRVTLCRKVMGRKKGEPLVRITDVEFTDVRREPLHRLLQQDGNGPMSSYGAREVALEGFPGMLPWDFVHQFFVEMQGIHATAEVTRIAWRYLGCECLDPWHRGQPCTREAADHSPVVVSPDLCLPCLHTCDDFNGTGAVTL